MRKIIDPDVVNILRKEEEEKRKNNKLFQRFVKDIIGSIAMYSKDKKIKDKTDG